MDKKTDIADLYADVKTCAVIRAYLHANKLIGLCNVNEVEGEVGTVTLHHNNYKKSYDTPVRLGELLDQLTYYNNMNDSPIIYFNGGMLDVNQGIFTDKSDKQVYLTEKEVSILSLLHDNKGAAISRAKLLKYVWNYVDAIETHTLETHIYRLRQKIEKDPANPQILITKEDGYSLS